VTEFDNEFRQGYKGMRERLAESNWTTEQASIALERWRERVSTPYNLGAKKAVEDFIEARKPADPADPDHLAPASGLEHRDLK